MKTHCSLWTEVRDDQLCELIFGCLPEGSYRSIFIKPNWVRHQADPAFPIQALVTDARIVEAAIEACLVKYSQAHAITVADAPLLDCDWPLLAAQAGLSRLEQRYARLRNPRVSFVDLRTERACRLGGGYLRRSADGPGDPLGVSEVVLGADSLLEEITTEEARFQVADYEEARTRSHHRRGFHRYRIAASALACDLFVNLPKVKTHQKAGITAALKNLVGIVADKSCLTHFRKGLPGGGGDEFAPGTPALVRFQTRLRERLQGRSRLVFGMGSAAWRGLRVLAGIQVRGLPDRLEERFYTAGGAWWGNDTIWRMIYDLNRIIRYAPPGGGRLAHQPQRNYVAILDGLVAGEGNGPLQPLPVPLGLLAASDDPFLADMAVAGLIGFEPEKIPVLGRRERFGADWGQFATDEAEMTLNGVRLRGIRSLPILHRFRPAPGWRGHIEREQSCAA